MKKICFSIACVLALCLISFRIYWVNASAEQVESETFSAGEWVALDGNFLQIAKENTAGYSVMVESAELVSYPELMARYGKSEDYWTEISRHPTILVTVRIKNEANETGGLVLSQWRLFIGTRNYSFLPSEIGFALTEPKIGSVFSLNSIRPDSEYTVVIPYVLDELRVDQTQQIENDPAAHNPYYLQLTTYPKKLYIQLEI